MARLVGSSEPGAVEQDQALWLLTERTVLAAAVCAELERDDRGYGGRRPRAAFGHLRRWVAEKYPSPVALTSCTDGLDAMVVPAGAEDLMEELRSASEVATALATMYTADSFEELRDDEEVIAARLADHRRLMASPLHERRRRRATRPSP